MTYIIAGALATHCFTFFHLGLFNISGKKTLGRKFTCIVFTIHTSSIVVAVHAR